jgi:hypothetical protein
MRRSTLLPWSGNLVTAKEAAQRKEKLGLRVAKKRRGWGFKPTSGNSSSEYTKKERTADATKNFIGSCVRACLEDVLKSTNPTPPKILRREIRKAGGNTQWLFCDADRLHKFGDEFSRQQNRSGSTVKVRRATKAQKIPKQPLRRGPERLERLTCKPEETPGPLKRTERQSKRSRKQIHSTLTAPEKYAELHRHAATARDHGRAEANSRRGAAVRREWAWVVLQNTRV